MSHSDPLVDLAARYPYDPGQILAAARGQAYVAIMLAGGQIGVCATLGHPVETDPLMLHKPDLSRTDHRILSCAFFNACHNGHQPYEPSGDIFNAVDFSTTSQAVMIGDFQPLVERFRASGIPLKLFDLKETGNERLPIEEMPAALSAAERVILTSTTIFNGTFGEVLRHIGSECEVYLLGPSSPLDSGLCIGTPIRRIFGMVFEPYDFKVLELIANGHGTRSFSSLGKKVSLQG